MNIWIIDHYSVPVKYYPLARNTNFAKNLKRMGNEVTIFAASSVHNSSINLNNNKPYCVVIDQGITYVLINCHQYSGNGLKRIMNMLEFSLKLEKVCSQFPRPDAIIATSMTLFACKKGIQIGDKYGCIKIAQITDLWPETLIAYGKAKKNHPLVLWFRRIEKWIYKNADRIVFSMEGAYDYIIEQGWEGDVPKSKVFCINNGIELDEFDYNKNHFQIDDEDLKNDTIFKAIYTGSIRQVNNVGMLVEVAKEITNPNIVILIWGDGNQKEELENLCNKEGIKNIRFKGKVEKKYIPYITSKADINLAHSTSTPLFRFGMSLNKMFDYSAAGKPILVDFEGEYNPVIKMNAGIGTINQSPKTIAKAIESFYEMDRETYDGYCRRAIDMAKKYDFEHLTKNLLNVINNEPIE